MLRIEARDRCAVFPLLMFLSFFLLFNPGKLAAAPVSPAPPTVYVTSPWLASMAQFIVGTTIKVQPLSVWSPDGRLSSVRRPPAGGIVIALDPKDAARYGLKAGRKDLSLLYENLPVKEERRSSLFFDPSTLPFLSQRLLVVLCELKPENYGFYQRRLAEFQSRLESTLEVGRSLLPDARALDLTGAAGPWVRAALTEAVRPPDVLWTAWEKGQRLEELSSALVEAKKRSWWIILDAWTPAQIRAKVLGQYENIVVGAPGSGQDFFTYLHDVYLGIWSTMTKSGK